MDIFPGNTLASFTNHFDEQYFFDGDWAVALTEIFFPSGIKNVEETEISVFNSDDDDDISIDSDDPDVVVSRLINDPDVIRISKPKEPSKKITLREGFYESAEQLLNYVKTEAQFNKFDFTIDPLTSVLTLSFGKGEGLTFPNNHIPGLLGHEGVFDREQRFGVHIGHKKFGPFAQQNDHTGNYPVEMTAGTQFMFVYVDFIEYQQVGDTKAPLLRVIETERRLKNGSLYNLTPVNRKSFDNLEYKKLLTSSLQSVKVELRTETGKPVPFLGTGKVVLSLVFKKL